MWQFLAGNYCWAINGYESRDPGGVKLITAPDSVCNGPVLDPEVSLVRDDADTLRFIGVPLHGFTYTHERATGRNEIVHEDPAAAQIPLNGAARMRPVVRLADNSEARAQPLGQSVRDDCARQPSDNDAVEVDALKCGGDIVYQTFAVCPEGPHIVGVPAVYDGPGGVLGFDDRTALCGDVKYVDLADDPLKIRLIQRDSAFFSFDTWTGVGLDHWYSDEGIATDPRLFGSGRVERPEVFFFEVFFFVELVGLGPQVRIGATRHCLGDSRTEGLCTFRSDFNPGVALLCFEPALCLTSLSLLVPQAVERFPLVLCFHGGESDYPLNEKFHAA